jgi:hypothetical protein
MLSLLCKFPDLGILLDRLSEQNLQKNLGDPGVFYAQSYFNLAMALARRLFLREAVFVKMVFFFTALSKVDMAFFMAAMASDFLPSVINLRTSLTADLNLFFTAVLKARRFIDCLMALPADLVLGTYENL